MGEVPPAPRYAANNNHRDDQEDKKFHLPSLTERAAVCQRTPGLSSPPPSPVLPRTEKGRADWPVPSVPGGWSVPAPEPSW